MLFKISKTVFKFLGYFCYKICCRKVLKSPNLVTLVAVEGVRRRRRRRPRPLLLKNEIKFVSVSFSSANIKACQSSWEEIFSNFLFICFKVAWQLLSYQPTYLPSYQPTYLPTYLPMYLPTNVPRSPPKCFQSCFVFSFHFYQLSFCVVNQSLSPPSAFSIAFVLHNDQWFALFASLFIS